VQFAVERIDDHLPAVQLGITMTSLGPGWTGEPAVADCFVNKGVVKSSQLVIEGKDGDMPAGSSRSGIWPVIAARTVPRRWLCGGGLPVRAILRKTRVIPCPL